MKVIKEKLPDTREEWLAQRARGLGGSDAGAVMGVNKYKSAYTLWAEKTGILPAPDIDNEAMRQGRDLENYVAQRFVEETGKRVKRSNFCYTAIDHPHMRANIDRLIVGENAGLECKTANLFADADYQEGQIPQSYYCQCLHYMATLGLDRMYLACLVLGRNFHVFTIDIADPGVAEDMVALVAAEEEFWQLVKDGTPPQIDGSDSTTDTLKSLYPQSAQDNTADLNAFEDLFSQREDLQKEKKRIDELLSAIENQVREELKDAEKGLSRGWSVSFKTQQRVTIDSKKLKAERPDVAEIYSKKITSRPLTIKKRKGA